MISNEEILEKVDEAIDSAPERGFQENVDMAINLKNIDLSDPNNRVDLEIVLPNGLGKDVKVCVMGNSAQMLNVENADKKITPEELEKLGEDKSEARSLAKEIDFFLAEADLMPKIGKILGPILGPRGKMPDPIRPGDEVEPKIDRLKNTVKLRSGESSTFHTMVGKVDLGEEKIAENINTMLKRLERALPQARQNIDSIHIKTTMGPSVELI
ncbi:50S ribosomal protein L1 [Methanonatronarchaeum sp. AMET6-2]|uniref:50S ribosomal protein L1 n=1 Tax=Methanonatronarchaeum sp. AMET6-2 TaxID=2933293 RepID=UPI001213E03F|nr:50S ribosomal protein L1 [Methanonatronarchaeum sp. AMET6-2]RZN61127.1 MAG: 50S ribosomal protein L1 [Methanonatronarchaeia archaeon]UOY09815.1 50S ribosomal protein L1 [Methanonatronarchaeum sp. AMET6-2]